MRALLAGLLFAVLVGVAITSAHAQGQQTVPLPESIDRRGTHDVTAEMNSFFAQVPDGSTVVFPSGGRYRVEGTLLFEDRRNLTFDGNGSEVFAATEGEKRRLHFEFVRGADITIRDLRVKGGNPQAGLAKEAYDREREFQHGFSFRGTEGVLLERVTVTDVYGDFVYLGYDVRGNGEWTTDVVVRHSTFERNGRQGMTITGAEEVVIEGNRFTDVRHNVIDIEANDEKGGGQSVRIEGNEARNWRFYFLTIGGQGTVNEVSALNNQLSGRFLGVLVKPARLGLSTPRSGLVIANNTSDTPARRSPIDITGLQGGRIEGNVQPFEEGVPAIRLVNSCDVAVGGNTFPGAKSEVERVGECGMAVDDPAGSDDGDDADVGDGASSGVELSGGEMVALGGVVVLLLVALGAFVVRDRRTSRRSSSP